MDGRTDREYQFPSLGSVRGQVPPKKASAITYPRSLGIASHWFRFLGPFMPEHTSAVSMLDRLLHHCHVTITDGDSYRMRQTKTKGGTQLRT